MHRTLSDDRDDTVKDGRGALRCARLSGCREWERSGYNVGIIDRQTGLCAECIVDAGFRAIDGALAGDRLTERETDQADALRQVLENVPMSILASLVEAHWERVARLQAAAVTP